MHGSALVTTLVSLAACGGGSPKGGGPVDPLPSCTSGRPTMVHALIGPDANVRVVCRQAMAVPIASVDVIGGGTVTFSVSVQGEAFLPAQPLFVASANQEGPQSPKSSSHRP